MRYLGVRIKMVEYLDIYDGEEVVGSVRRDICHKLGLLHKVVVIYIFDSEGKLIFQKRAKNKKIDGGKLDHSAGGHVSSGKEIEERRV